MLRRRYGETELSPDVVQAEMIEVLSQTLDNLYQALDAKDATIERLMARLRQLGQSGQDERACRSGANSGWPRPRQAGF